MKTCPDCGRSADDTSLNCPDCGRSLSSFPSAAPSPPLVGIGGWLILPAIGLILGAVIGGVGLVACFEQFSVAEKAGFGGVFTLEIISQLVMLVFCIYAATRFFGKKKEAPATMIAFMLTGIAISGLLLVIELSSGPELFAIESGKALVKGFIEAAIWIPYFRGSRRVKATFVN